MPTYEYACRSCGAHVEVYQRFSDPPLTECSVCGGPLRKVFHPAGILFKGTGFYATDSRRATASDGSGSEGKESGKEPAAKGDPGSRVQSKDPAATKPSAGSTADKAAPSSKKESA